MPLNIPPGDCEYAWYLMNGTCVAHSDGKMLGPVVAMTFQNLTVSACEDLQWQLHCDNIQLQTLRENKMETIMAIFQLVYLAGVLL